MAQSLAEIFVVLVQTGRAGRIEYPANTDRREEQKSPKIWSPTPKIFLQGIIA
jgi:hypothetical protein